MQKPNKMYYNMKTNIITDYNAASDDIEKTLRQIHNDCRTMLAENYGNEWCSLKDISNEIADKPMQAWFPAQPDSNDSTILPCEIVSVRLSEKGKIEAKFKRPNGNTTVEKYTPIFKDEIINLQAFISSAVAILETTF